MEQTTNTGSSSKIVIWIVVILIVILGIWLSMRNDIEAPADTNTPTVSSNDYSSVSEKTQLQASVGEAMNFDNEASMKEVDKEFQ